VAVGERRRGRTGESRSSIDIRGRLRFYFPAKVCAFISSLDLDLDFRVCPTSDCFRPSPRGDGLYKRRECKRYTYKCSQQQAKARLSMGKLPETPARKSKRYRTQSRRGIRQLRRPCSASHWTTPVRGPAAGRNRD
jgi:hypothetical protein